MTMHVQPFFDAGTSTYSYVIDDGAGHCAIVDPVLGFDPRSGRTDPAPAQAVADHVARGRLTVDWLLETHAHADHLSAAPWLQRRLGGRLGIGAGITQVQQAFRGIFNAGEMAVDGSQFDHLFQDGERFAIGRLNACAMHLPGHTPADAAYRVESPDGAPDAVFVGDTLFMPDVGTARCDFPGGDAHALYRSIGRLLSLPAQTRLYVCHDYPPATRPPACWASVADQRRDNIHLAAGVSEEDFVARRTARDATLALPALMLPSVQVNMRGGQLPPTEANGTAYLKIPLDLL
ncbi:MBL fold metallo-hydrolase [Xylophilus sp. Kf1]|nr:MBL fold metallo-hydrolase [Xylophilus sp. Kf1]